MNTSVLQREEDCMTDFQFKTIIKMVLAIAEESKDADTIIKKLKELLPENEK